jgi:hypothetical protein
MVDKDNNQKKDIPRRKALKQIGNYSKYAALTALSTYLILNPQTAQANSGDRPDTPGNWD